MGPCGWHFLWVPICHVPSHQFVSLHFFPSYLWRFAIWQWYGLSSFVSFFFSLPSDFIFFIQSETNPNWALGFAKIHHSRYLTGYLAGLTTKNGRIGNIAAVPIPEARVYLFHNKKFAKGKKTHKCQTISFPPQTYNGVNAFYAGLIDANPDITFYNSWCNVWVKQDLEIYQAEYIIANQHVDVLARDTDSQDPTFIAAESQLFSIGYNVDASRFVAGTVLSSAIWNWDILYIYFIDKIIHGQWVCVRSPNFFFISFSFSPRCDSFPSSI